MVRQTLQQLGDASNQMRTTSSGLSAVSRQTNERVEVARKASGEASMSVESVASASEELSASINDISQQAAHAAGIASRAVSQARDTDGTVQGLAKSAGRIGEVVGLINTIAAQTNLLALNATIEAARAGDAGRGFAVVASEVKSLASQTAKATEEISEQIADIQKVAGEAIDAIKGIGGIIGEVNEVATAIAAAVQEQGAATQEISRSTQHAAQGTKNVSDNITGVKADADAAASAAENVKPASETLETPEPATRQPGRRNSSARSAPRKLIASSALRRASTLAAIGAQDVDGRVSGPMRRDAGRRYSEATTGHGLIARAELAAAGEKFSAAPRGRRFCRRPSIRWHRLRDRPCAGRIVLDLDLGESELILAVAGAAGDGLVAIAERVRQFGVRLSGLGHGAVDVAAIDQFGFAGRTKTVAGGRPALIARPRDRKIASIAGAHAIGLTTGERGCASPAKRAIDLAFVGERQWHGTTASMRPPNCAEQRREKIFRVRVDASAGTDRNTTAPSAHTLPERRSCWPPEKGRLSID